MTYSEMNERLTEFFVKNRSITQKDFAERAGVSSVTISALMQNRTPPRKLHARTAAKIIDALDDANK